MNLRPFEDELLRICNKIILTLIKKGVNREDAKDIVQTSVVKLLEANLSIHADSLQAWLYRVSFNQYYSQYQRGKTFNRLLEQYIVPRLFMPTEADFDSANLYQALATLEETELNLVLLKYVENMSYRELAIVFGKSEETLKTESYRIRKKLQQKIKEMDANDGR